MAERHAREIPKSGVKQRIHLHVFLVQISAFWYTCTPQSTDLKHVHACLEREQELAAGKIAALKAIGVVFNGSGVRKLCSSIEMNIAKAGPAQPSVSHESVSQGVSHSLPTLRFKNASEEDEWSKMFG